MSLLWDVSTVYSDVDGIYYKTPFIDRGNEAGLCWAGCEVAYAYSVGWLTDLSQSAKKVNELGASPRRNDNFSGNLPMKNVVAKGQIDFNVVKKLLETAKAPIGAVFADKDGNEAHQILITGVYVMGGNRYVSYYDPNKQLQTVKEYNEFCNYGDGKMLYQIGIVDEDKIMKDYN